MNDVPFKVQDKRKHNYYTIDNTFIDGYAKYVGWHGQCVYYALCRHARNNICFPSQKHLAIELNISVRSIVRGIKKLLEYNIISIQRKSRTERNEYHLLDKSKWKSNDEIKKNWTNKSKVRSDTQTLHSK